MACLPSRFTRRRWIRLVASLRYTLNYLHLSQQIFSLRSDISEENVTFKWLACTSQESVKIRTRERENARVWEGKNTRENNIKHARGKQHMRVLHTALIVLARKIWWCANSCSSNINIQIVLPWISTPCASCNRMAKGAWHIARTRVFGLARAYESYYPYYECTSRAPYLICAQIGPAGNQTGSRILIYISSRK